MTTGFQSPLDKRRGSHQLSLPENLTVLSETLGVELELEGREKPVGRFSADLLCKEVGADRWVLIENQLERTDHAHLGQLLTYSAGLQAVTIIWIASAFTEEHRAALDWLNQRTDDDVRFFGLEVELWKIGTSPAAPKFNIVAKPNDWSRSVAHAARSIADGEPTQTQALQQRYWAALHQVLNAIGGAVGGNRKPQLQSWMSYSIGRSGFHIGAVMNRQKRLIRAELYLSGSSAKAHFNLLLAQQSEIERELGYQVIWEELPAGTDSRISRWLSEVEPGDEADWSRQHNWLAVTLNDFHKVFAPRVKEVDAAKWQADI